MPYESFPDGVLVADENGIVTHANELVRRWHRNPDYNLVGMHIRDAVPLDDLHGTSWFDTVKPYDGLSIRRRINEQSWYSVRGNEYLITASIIRDKPGGKVTKLIVCARSTQIRKRLDRHKSDMVATVAHELRSPLTGIKGFSATLIHRWDAFTEDQRKFMLETIDADADRLSRLVTELLDAARIDSGRMSLRTGPVNLDQLAARVLESVYATAKTKPQADIIGTIPVVWGDSDRLTQVFTNLVENAIRHGEGLKALEVENIQRDGKDGVAVRVIDSGPGIPVDQRDRVFSRFWRAGPGAGSGLGMFIVKGVVSLHQGEITIQDAEPKGARISAWIPVNEPSTLTDA